LVGVPAGRSKDQEISAMRFYRLAVLLGLLGVPLLASQAVAQAPSHYDPPARVARLSYLEGDVSFSPAGEPDWVQAGINRPLIRGDRLWSDRRGRAELQIGGAAIRLDEYTAVSLLELDDRLGQFELTEGRINLFVRRLHPDQSYEIATPTLALVITEPGSYTVEVAEDGRWTEVQMWRGSADAYGERARFPLMEGDSVRFYDARLRDYEFAALRPTEFDRFSFTRDERFERSPSLRYVSDDVIGYDDLDRYGSWSRVSDYGPVWFPTRVSAGWAPYRHGHWIWQEPWGWTWVDDAPWGFASSHYGRWVLVRDRWGWVPAPPRARAVYAPALVAFVGGSNWSVGVSLRSDPIGWFPLGPRDIYVPSYRVSRDYFTRVNYGPTYISNTQIINIYNNYYVRDRSLAQIDYSYRSMSSAVTVVPSDVFIRSQPVSRAALRVDTEAFTRAEVRRVANFAPSQRSIIGAAQAASVQPRQEVFERQVVARTAPPPEIAPFSRRQAELQRQPGLAPERPIVRSAEPREANGQRGDNQVRRQVRVIDATEVREIDREAPRTADDQRVTRERIERVRSGADQPSGRGNGERRRATEQEWRSRVEERETQGEQPSPRARDVPADRGRGVVPPSRDDDAARDDARPQQGRADERRGGRDATQRPADDQRADEERRGREAAQARQDERRIEEERRGRPAAERGDEEPRGREAAQQRQADDERGGREAAQQRQAEQTQRAEEERRGREAAQQRQEERRADDERRGREAAQQRQAEQAQAAAEAETRAAAAERERAARAGQGRGQERQRAEDEEEEEGKDRRGRGRGGRDD
jgi:hypothetical protein